MRNETIPRPERLASRPWRHVRLSPARSMTVLVVAALVLSTVACTAGFGGEPRLVDLKPLAVSIRATSQRDVSAGPVQACLEPRKPQRPPPGGWVLAHGGAELWDTEGDIHNGSTEAKAVASVLVKDLRAGFFVQDVWQRALPSCVTEIDLYFATKNRATGYLEVVQLRRPVDWYSFPLLGQMVRVKQTMGVELLASETGDRSSVTEAGARTDGLVAFIQVESASGPNVTGWPTTFAPPRTTIAPQPAPLSVPQVRVVLLNILAYIARQRS